VNYLLPERLDRLAREYALGTLAGPARRRFERVLRSSAAASTAVNAWQGRLSVLDLSTAPVQPRESTWRGIERQLFATPDRAASPSMPSGGVLQALLGLLSARGLAGAVVGALLCVVVLRMQPGIVGLEPQVDALPQSYVGVLLDPAGKAALVASSRRQGRLLTVKLLQPLDVPRPRRRAVGAAQGRRRAVSGQRYRGAGLIAARSARHVREAVLQRVPACRQLREGAVERGRCSRRRLCADRELRQGVVRPRARRASS
jgi:hypothetical protein